MRYLSFSHLQSHLNKTLMLASTSSFRFVLHSNVYWWSSDCAAASEVPLCTTSRFGMCYLWLLGFIADGELDTAQSVMLEYCMTYWYEILEKGEASLVKDGFSVCDPMAFRYYVYRNNRVLIESKDITQFWKLLSLFAKDNSALSSIYRKFKQHLR